MKWLNNLFKKEEVIKPKSTLDVKIDGTKYSIDDFDYVKVQSIDNDIKPYGWVVETRYKNSGQNDWYTYITNKIYGTRSSAMHALLSAKKSYVDGDFRITAIYSMDQNFYRNHKINKLFDESKPNLKKYDIKAWKIKEDFTSSSGWKLKRKTVFIQLENGRVIKSGGYSDVTQGSYRHFLFDELIPNDLVEEVELKDEKWLYPHLLKELKLKLKK